MSVLFFDQVPALTALPAHTVVPVPTVVSILTELTVVKRKTRAALTFFDNAGKNVNLTHMMSKTLIWKIPDVWEEPVREYTLRLAAFGKSKATIHTRVSALRSFAREINCAPQEVTEKLIITWAGTKEWSPETRHSKFCTLRSFYAWYSPLNEITNPALHLPSIRRFIPPPRPTPENVFKDALHSANKRTQLILKLAGNYGLRAGEIAIVHQHDIGNDTSEPYLTVHGKGNKDRVIPITTTFYEEMLLHVNTVTGWLFPGNFHGHLSPRWISKIGSKALPRGWTLHTLRHRCGTRAYAVQHDLLAVQTLLGHEKVSTTQRYVLPNETGMRTAIESIELTL